MDAQLNKVRREPKWNPATLEKVTLAAITQRFFDAVLEDPVRAPMSVDGEAVLRDNPEYGGIGRKRVGGVGSVGGFEEQHQHQHQHQYHQQHQQHQHQGEDRKTNYGLPTEEEIRAVLMRGRTGSINNVGMRVVGMTRKQLEMAIKGDRPAIKLGLKERLDEVIARKELAVEGSDRLVWREELTEE